MYKFQGDISGKLKTAPWYKLACHCKAYNMLQNSTFPKLSVALESRDVYCGPIHSSLLRAGREKAYLVFSYIRGGYYLE